MANISFYGSHNSAIVVENDGKILCVIEAERFTGYKNGAIAQYKVVKDGSLTLELILEWIEKTYGINHFDTCYWSNGSVNHDNVLWPLHKFIPAHSYKEVMHHQSHANGVFYQSPYEKALIFSFDGGGNDGKFHIYLADRRDGLTLLNRVSNPHAPHPSMEWDLGFPYMIFGQYLKDIKLEPLGDGNLVYSGKLMGLASYGKVREDWLPHFIEFYRKNPDGHHSQYLELLDILGEKINIKFDINSRLSGQDAYDIAATSQKAFEECFLEIATPYLNQYPDLPVCLTGGCGLNIILNTRLSVEFKKQIFVGPNPNDCGIALGMMLGVLKPKTPFDATYVGLPILDYDTLAMYIQDRSHTRKLIKTIPKYPKHSEINFKNLVQDLYLGDIVGVVRGNSEHGPRALGNRSIICNPSIADMKDILNAKVKHREWYRPFAPVVRLEDVNKYFEWDKDARWMSFCPTVREEWRTKLPAITHVDNTARVQTVTREQNPWLYDLLTEFNNLYGIGVLLNTSFNVNGKPILSTLREAFQVFDNTDMDGLVIEDYYFRKTEFRPNISYEF